MPKDKDKKKINTKDVALAGSSLGAIGASRNMILGKKRMYHGTSNKNWEKIKTEGLRANMGGLGGASQSIGSKDYVNTSKGTIHTTRIKPLANMYANMNEVDSPKSMKEINLREKMYSYYKEDPKTRALSIDKSIPGWENAKNLESELNKFKSDNMNDLMKEKRRMFTKKSKNGRVLKLNMDYNKFKKMTIDNVGSDDISDIPDLAKNIAKNFAAKGKVNISPEEIIGSSATRKDRIRHTLKNMPSYIKNNPLRFGSGVALAGAGAYGLKRLYDKKREKTVFEIVVESFEKLSNTL